LRSREPRDPALAKHKRGQVKAACVACQRGKVKVRYSAYTLRKKRLFSFIPVVKLILKA
jgi:hypothetical protein